MIPTKLGWGHFAPQAWKLAATLILFTHSKRICKRNHKLWNIFTITFATHDANYMGKNSMKPAKFWTQKSIVYCFPYNYCYHTVCLSKTLIQVQSHVISSINSPVFILNMITNTKRLVGVMAFYFRDNSCNKKWFFLLKKKKKDKKNKFLNLSQFKVTRQDILYTNHTPWNLHIGKIKWWTHKAQTVVRVFTLWFVWIWMLNMFHFRFAIRPCDTFCDCFIWKIP